MKILNVFFLLVVSIQSFSQINSPNGSNLFYYNGLADVTFRFADRGTGGRAFVHDVGNTLTLNYDGDFTGGVKIGTSVFFNQTGNVGIGTNAPGYKFHVVGGHPDSRILLHSTGRGDDAGQADLMLWASEPGWTWTGTGIGNNVLNSYANGTAINRINNARGGSYLRLLDNSLTLNIVSSAGIDKTALSISESGDIATSNMLFLNVYNSAQIRLNSSGTYYGKIGNPSAQIWSLGYGSGGSDLNSVLSWTASGNVLIGKTTQKEAKYKLDVDGPVRADEITVNTTGADFVFDNNYKLRTLAEVEAFIKANKHLPDVAPAADMQTNGVNMGDMQAKLLQKVEELTLYVIEQDKVKAKVEEQEKQLQEQRQANEELQKEVKELKELLMKKLKQ